MQPTQAMIDSVAALIAADTALLAAAAVKNVNLVIAPFTPAPTTAFGDLTIADFTGSAAKTAAAGAQQAYLDPITGEWVVQLVEPVGGWHWEATALTNLPQTVHGFVVTNDDDTETLGSQLLDTPITINAVGQGLNLGQIQFRLPVSPLS